MPVVVVSNLFPLLAANVLPAVDHVVQGAAREAEQAAKGYAPVRTGAMRDAIAAEGTGLGSARVVSPAPYSGYVEFGRGPVYPVNAKALHFFVGGEEVFAAHVGPAAAEPFMRPAADDAAAWAETQSLEPGLL